MAHEYLLYVTFVPLKIVLRHPNRDASKNVSTPTISEFYEILRASYILRDDSNGEIRFIIRYLENKFQIFNRNYDFALFPEIGISRVLQLPLSAAWTHEEGLPLETGIPGSWDSTVPIGSRTEEDTVCSSTERYKPERPVSVSWSYTGTSHFTGRPERQEYG